ncbi:MAG: 4-alpha-glucanotransferase [Spirochaetia bacterium]
MYDTGKSQEKTIGISIPIFALRSKQCHEWGDFLALKDLGQWAHKCSLKVIQILPIHDTGTNACPYSLQSAFALNPVYSRISEIFEHENQKHPLSISLEFYQKSITGCSYQHIHNAKMAFLGQIYQDAEIWQENIILEDWIARNDWVIPYAVFCFLKDKYQQAHWQDWLETTTPSPEDIAQLWQTHLHDCLFYAWVQYHLDRQLCCASSFLRDLGIAIKGDLPMMMGYDSVDVWFHREYFNLNQHVGGPADPINTDGKVLQAVAYNWENQEKNDFQWWKNRLDCMERFCRFISINDAGNFFRTWIIPSGIADARCGYFSSSHPIKKQELLATGFSEEDIAQISSASITNKILKKNEHIICEKEQTHILEHCSLLNIDAKYYPCLNYKESHSFKSLPSEKKVLLEAMIVKKEMIDKQEQNIQAEKILKALLTSTSSILCAQQLAPLPSCMHETLDRLGIIRAYIVPWMDDPCQSGELITIISYPKNSLASLSYHASTTMREWWESDPKKIRFLLRSLGLQEEIAEEDYTPQLTMTILHAFIKNTQSRLIVLSLQDYLALSDQYRTGCVSEEAICLPGNCQQAAWHYRIKPSLEDLIADKRFIFLIKVTNTIL